MKKNVITMLLSFIALTSFSQTQSIQSLKITGNTIGSNSDSLLVINPSTGIVGRKSPQSFGISSSNNTTLSTQVTQSPVKDSILSMFVQNQVIGVVRGTANQNFADASGETFWTLNQVDYLKNITFNASNGSFVINKKGLYRVTAYSTIISTNFTTPSAGSKIKLYNSSGVNIDNYTISGFTLGGIPSNWSAASTAGVSQLILLDVGQSIRFVWSVCGGCGPAGSFYTGSNKYASIEFVSE